MPRGLVVIGSVGPVPVILMYHGVSPSARDQPTVHRKCSARGQQQRQRQAPPEEPRVERACIAPGMTSISALSTTSMMAIEAVSDANASQSTVPVAMPAWGSGLTVRA